MKAGGVPGNQLAVWLSLDLPVQHPRRESVEPGMADWEEQLQN